MVLFGVEFRVVEKILALTYDLRGKFIARYVRRMSEREIWERYDSEKGRRFKARVILLDMMSEYVGGYFIVRVSM